MRNIKLKDGTTYQVDRCGAADGLLRIRILPPFDVREVFETFFDHSKTDRIEHYFDGTETDHVFFDHYTSVLALEVDGDKLLIIMKEVTPV